MDLDKCYTQTSRDDFGTIRYLRGHHDSPRPNRSSWRTIFDSLNDTQNSCNRFTRYPSCHRSSPLAYRKQDRRWKIRMDFFSWFLSSVVVLLVAHQAHLTVGLLSSQVMKGTVRGFRSLATIRQVTRPQLKNHFSVASNIVTNGVLSVIPGPTLGRFWGPWLPY